MKTTAKKVLIIVLMIVTTTIIAFANFSGEKNSITTVYNNSSNHVFPADFQLYTEYLPF